MKPKARRNPPLKFIDRLQKELVGAGIVIKRGGMDDYSLDKDGKMSQFANDPCEWVTIILKNEDGSKKYEVEFYFTNSSKKLESVHLYVKKKKKGYGSGKLIGLDKRKAVLPKDSKRESKPVETFTMYA